MARLAEKLPFDIDTAVHRIRATVRSFADAAMFELRDRGYGSVFQQLVACLVSIRTRDELSLPLAIRLFERAPNPADVARLGADGIDALIEPSTFHEAKARQILAIAERAVAEYGGVLPCDAAVLTSFRGVGPKCANLTLGVACGHAHISVDIHVHRVTNRWGIVLAPTPERTMLALEEVLPKRYWIEINRLLVPFGKFLCKRLQPACSTCPVLDMCQQVGVDYHR